MNGLRQKWASLRRPYSLDHSRVNVRELNCKPSHSSIRMGSIQQKRLELLSHPMYKALDSPQHVRIFMKHHVFAVWDFMSLLKRLQQQLTCVSVPWTPPVNAEFARLINDIVIGEETDEYINGGYISHFELYLQAMKEVGADTSPIENFLNRMRHGLSVSECLDSEDIPSSVNNFVTSTLLTAMKGHPHEVAASFFYGREEVIPDMFRMMVRHIENQGGRADRLMYYLDRHIAVDGGHHGPLAEKLLQSLCGDDHVKTNEAEKVAVNALSMRVQLWNGVLEEIKSL